MADRQLSRVKRQFAAIAQLVPPSRGVIEALLTGPLRWVRLPVAVSFLLGGVFSFLPMLGLWMLPLGLLLLAVDVPALRPAVTTGTIRARRRLRLWLRRIPRTVPPR